MVANLYKEKRKNVRAETQSDLHAVVSSTANLVDHAEAQEADGDHRLAQATVEGCLELCKQTLRRVAELRKAKKIEKNQSASVATELRRTIGVCEERLEKMSEMRIRRSLESHRKSVSETRRASTQTKLEHLALLSAAEAEADDESLASPEASPAKPVQKPKKKLTPCPRLDAKASLKIGKGRRGKKRLETFTALNAALIDAESRAATAEAPPRDVDDVDDVNEIFNYLEAEEELHEAPEDISVGAKLRRSLPLHETESVLTLERERRLGVYGLPSLKGAPRRRQSQAPTHLMMAPGAKRQRRKRDDDDAEKPKRRVPKKAASPSKSPAKPPLPEQPAVAPLPSLAPPNHRPPPIHVREMIQRHHVAERRQGKRTRRRFRLYESAQELLDREAPARRDHSNPASRQVSRRNSRATASRGQSSAASSFRSHPG